MPTSCAKPTEAKSDLRSYQPNFPGAPCLRPLFALVVASPRNSTEVTPVETFTSPSRAWLQNAKAQDAKEKARERERERDREIEGKREGWRWLR